MKCSVFIATSVDGFIADEDGNVDWLETSGNKEADMADQADMGFNDFIQSVDCMIMGRKTMEIISGFNLPPEQWPYGDIRIIVLSRTLKTLPDNVVNKMELCNTPIPDLVEELTHENFSNVYIDGGKTIQSFLNLGLISDITLTRAPVLLGTGIPLFGKMDKEVTLTQASATAYANDFIQEKYKVNYA